MIARGFMPETATLDKGYDTEPIRDGCEERGVRPIVPLKTTAAVKKRKHKPSTCEHGEWMFAGADFKRKLTKWRCPSGECKPASVWRKASRLHLLIPRDSKRWGDLYRGRGAVERAFGRLKNERGLKPLESEAMTALHSIPISASSPRHSTEREPFHSRRRPPRLSIRRATAIGPCL